MVIAQRCLGEMFPTSMSLEMMVLLHCFKMNPAYNPNSKVLRFLDANLLLTGNDRWASLDKKYTIPIVNSFHQDTTGTPPTDHRNTTKT